MAAVKVYSTRICWYCDQAKRLLARKGIAFEDIDVSDDADARRWLVETTGRRTVPQIFIHGEAIGGFNELSALDRSGGLQPLLAGDAD